MGIVPFQDGLIPSAAKRQFNARIEHLVLSRQVDRISLDTGTSSKLLIVRWTAALQVIRDQGAELQAERAVVVAHHPPLEPGSRRSYDVGVVARNVERLFGVRPTWAPQSEHVGSMIQPLLPASDIEDFSWKGITRVKASAYINRYYEGKPFTGRHCRDDPAEWPSSQTAFRKVYPVDGSVDVCILGAANVPKERDFLPRYGNSWEIYAFIEIEGDGPMGVKRW